MHTVTAAMTNSYLTLLFAEPRTHAEWVTGPRRELGYYSAKYQNLNSYLYTHVIVHSQSSEQLTINTEIHLLKGQKIDYRVSTVTETSTLIPLPRTQGSSWERSQKDYKSKKQ